MNRTKIEFYKDKKWLKTKYLIERLGIYQIAPICNCHPRTIHQWLIKFDIQRRKSGFSNGMSEEQKELRRIWNKQHPEIKRMKGKNHSSETRTRMSLSRRGYKNANWRGGKTTQTRGIRRSPEYFQWRKAVLKRDEMKCQRCGDMFRLHVHHIKPINKYPHLIFDLFNGITLCETCHVLTERKVRHQ